jgi:adenylate kinase
MNKNKLVILIGSPGSGKGAQALLLADKKKMDRLEASKLLEKKFLHAGKEEVAKIDGKEYSLNEQERRWREGLLCEDEFVAHVIKEALKKETEDGFGAVLLDGYPRTVEQASLAMPFIFSLYKKENILVIYLKVDEEESLRRNKKRRVCSLMRHSIIDLPETKDLTVCPIDGSSLEKRKMDDPQKIKIRLEKFKEKTVPAIEYLSSQGISVAEVDRMGSIGDVFFRVLKEVEDFGL